MKSKRQLLISYLQGDVVSLGVVVWQYLSVGVVLQLLMEKKCLKINISNITFCF